MRDEGCVCIRTNEGGRTRLTAYEHLDPVATFRRRNVRADELATDVPLCTSPARWWVIQCMDDAERVRVRTLQRG
jgi:hypothetical protein